MRWLASPWISAILKRLVIQAGKRDVPRRNRPASVHQPGPQRVAGLRQGDRVPVGLADVLVRPVRHGVGAVEELDDCICPWCIASGAAHEKFDAEFTDRDGIEDFNDEDDAPDHVKDEVAFRTPGFAGWQQERWWIHCKDAAEFIGRGGKAEIEGYGEELRLAIQDSTGLSDGPKWDRFYNALSKTDPPSAYLFRCRHCGKYGGYTDTD